MDTIACLLCDHCSMPICSLSDIMVDRASVMGTAVYSYELDLLGADVWVYSATNPSARRFDVVRCSSSVVAQRSVKCEHRFSKEHSWFPPYAWCMCECASCGRHLGWGFSSTASTEDAEEPMVVVASSTKRHRVEPVRAADVRDRGDAHQTEADRPHAVGDAPVQRSAADGGGAHSESGSDGAQSESGSDGASSTEGEGSDAESVSSVCSAQDSDVAFVGIIVTNCKPVEDYPLGKYHELMELAGERQVQQRMFQHSIGRLFAILPLIPNQLAASHLAMQLMQLRFDRRNEVVGQLLASAEAMLADVTAAPDSRSAAPPLDGGGGQPLLLLDLAAGEGTTEGAVVQVDAVGEGVAGNSDGNDSASSSVDGTAMPPTETLGYERTLSMHEERGGREGEDVDPLP